MPGCIIIMPGCIIIIWTGSIICMPPWKDTHCAMLMPGGCIADAMDGAPMAVGSWAPAGRMTGACIMLRWNPAAGATIAGAYCTFS